MTRAVTELDFRMPEFQNADPADYEFRGDGKLVRKDRFHTGFQDIAYMLTSDDYEIPDVVQSVQDLLTGSERMANKLAADEIWWTLISGSFLFDNPFESPV